MISSARAASRQLSGWMVGDPPDDVSQIELGIDVVHPAGFDDRVHAGSTLSACVRTAEEVVLPAEDWGLHGAFGGVIAVSSLPSVT
jgi:hypothetical protein